MGSFPLGTAAAPIASSSVTRSRPSPDAELNLAPIIDCFTVLIIYLLVSASFLTVVSLDTGIAVFRRDRAASSSDTTVLELRVLDGGRLLFRLPGVLAPPRALLEPLDGTGALPRRLDQLLRAVPTLGEVAIGAAPSVPYADVVRTVELTKRYVAKVYLSAGGR